MRQRLYSKITDIYGICVNYYPNHRKKQTLQAENLFQLCLMQKQHKNRLTKQGWLNRPGHTHGMEENHRAGCK